MTTPDISSPISTPSLTPPPTPATADEGCASALPFAVSDQHLVWLDMEMSGLDPMSNRILEVAMVLTDAQLRVLDQSEAWVVHQTDEHLATMDQWNQSTHGKSGLIDKVRASTLNEATVEAALLQQLAGWIPRGAVPLCGNTIHQDRRFMQRYMPQLEAYFHYRNVDVSTIKELCRRWRPELLKGFVKKGAHTALADVLESIDEMRYYRDQFFAMPTR